MKGNLLKNFYPDVYLDSAYKVNYEGYYKKGYRGILMDIDNTLTEHGKKADKQAIRLFYRLQGIGFQCVLLSNNDEERVKLFTKDFKVPYIHKAGKPSPKSYLKAMEMMGTTAETTFFVGDQIFTDIYGANRAGIHSILVKPISPKEEFQIVLKRYPEKVVLHFYENQKKRGRQ